MLVQIARCSPQRALCLVASVWLGFAISAHGQSLRPPDDCDSPHCDPPRCEPAWLVRAGAVALDRDGPGEDTLFFNPLDPSEHFDSAAFDLGYQAGFDIGLIRRFDALPDVEFRWLSVDGWSDTAGAATTASDPLAIDAGIPIFVATGRTIEAVYGSDLQSFEWNLRTGGCFRRITWLAGFRYLELDESFQADLIDPVTPAPTVGYDVTTDNRLYGGQLGAELLLLGGGSRWQLELVGKAGLYYNDASQRSELDTGAVIVPAAGRADCTSFVGEAHLAFNWRVVGNLSLRASYGVIGIGEIAVATEQIKATEFVTYTGIEPDGSAFYHGAFLGLDCAW